MKNILHFRRCTDPMLARVARSVNDAMCHEERQKLLPLAWELVGTNCDNCVSERHKMGQAILEKPRRYHAEHYIDCIRELITLCPHRTATIMMPAEPEPVPSQPDDDEWAIPAPPIPVPGSAPAPIPMPRAGKA